MDSCIANGGGVPGTWAWGCVEGTGACGGLGGTWVCDGVGSSWAFDCLVFFFYFFYFLFAPVGVLAAFEHCNGVLFVGFEGIFLFYAN